MVIIWLMMGNYDILWLVVGGWPTPLKNDGVSSSVGIMMNYDIPNWMKSHKNHVPNHQPVVYDMYGMYTNVSLWCECLCDSLCLMFVYECRCLDMFSIKHLYNFVPNFDPIINSDRIEPPFWRIFWGIFWRSKLLDPQKKTGIVHGPPSFMVGISCTCFFMAMDRWTHGTHGVSWLVRNWFSTSLWKTLWNRYDWDINGL